MKKTLIDSLKEKYGSEYNIEEVEQFNEYNITFYESENGESIFKLRLKKSNGEIKTTWHTTEDTLVDNLLNHKSCD